MKEISEQEARRLILIGQAGYYSVHHNSVPIEHDQLIVVRLQHKCWLADETEFQVKCQGPIGVVAGRTKGAFIITCNQAELETMLQAELTEKGKAWDHER